MFSLYNTCNKTTINPSYYSITHVKYLIHRSSIMVFKMCIIEYY